VIWQPIEDAVGAVGQWKAGLLEEETTRSLNADYLAFVAQDDVSFSRFPHIYERGDFAGRAILELPVFPVAFIPAVRVADFNDVGSGKVKNVIFYKRELLNEIVNVERTARQSQQFTQALVWADHDAARTVAVKIDGHAIAFSVRERRKNPLPGIHCSRSFRILNRCT
jgi:hypothetical protein